jgi:hypothetical protein
VVNKMNSKKGENNEDNEQDGGNEKEMMANK